MTDKNKQQDPLLAELNGVDVFYEDPEVQKARDEAKIDPLQVKPKVETEAKKLQNSARAKGAIGYAFTVEGEYIRAPKESRGQKTKEPYKIVVNLPSTEKALSIIVRKLLDKQLRMTYPGYCTYRTHRITHVKPLTPDTPLPNNIAYMGMEQLKGHIAANNLPINPEVYPNEVMLREAVMDCVLNPKNFEEREARKLASLKEDQELAALNPGLNEAEDIAPKES